MSIASSRTLVKDLAAHADGPVTVSGWVETVRDQKKVQFVVLRDESGAVQLVNPALRELPDTGGAAVSGEEASGSGSAQGDPGTADPGAGAAGAQLSGTQGEGAAGSQGTGAAVSGTSAGPGADGGPAQASAALQLTETISALSLGSFVSVTGELKHDERVKLGGLEVKIASLDVAAASLPESPIAADSALDKRLDYRWIDLRQAKNALIFKIQTTLEHAWRNWWIENDFIEIHTPKLMSSPSESRAELFQLDYFELGTAYLAQSPQHFKQMAQAAGFGRVFEISPVFRADPSFTSRHATEFMSVDAEMSWIDSHEDVMSMQESLMEAGFAAVVARHGDEVRELFGVELSVPMLPFPRIPLAEVHEILAREGYTVPRADGDLDPEGERRISAYVKEQLGHDFVFVTDYPTGIRPYYHMRDEKTGLTRSYDLIYNGTEITTGAQREHRIDHLLANAADKGLDPAGIGEYLEFFRYGIPPHGGFGMGLARVLMLMLGLPSIRETTLLFRGPTRLAP